MKWYKRDPDAALSGMAELTFEECGAYNRLLDLLYSRDGNVPDDDAFCAMIFHCRPQVWRRLKLALMQKGKIRQTDGKLTANRVETELQSALKRIEIMRGLRQKQLENQRSTLGGSARTTTTTTTTRVEKKMPRKRGRPKVPLPDNWVPAEELSLDDQREFERFKNHARANDRRCADWLAAWRNWKTSPYRRPQNAASRQASGRPRTILEALDRIGEGIDGGDRGIEELREDPARLLPYERGR